MNNFLRLLFSYIFLISPHLTTSQTWSAVGTGMDNIVEALYTFNNELYAGGYFANAGGAPANVIARWNGTAWSVVAGNNIDGDIRSIGSFNNQLYIGGAFLVFPDIMNITKLNGNNWERLGPIFYAGSYGGVESWVEDMEVYNNELYVTGDFLYAGTFSPMRPEIAKWNGSAWGGSGGLSSWSFGLEIFQNKLYVGGTFAMVEDVVSSGWKSIWGLAQFDGATYTSIGNVEWGGGNQGTIVGMAVYNNELYVTGEFNFIDGVPYSGIARWNGSAWNTVGGTGFDIPGSAGWCMKVYNGELYLGGFFTSVGGVAANNIAKWNGASWSAVGSGTNSQVSAMEIFNGELYIGGEFTSAGGVANTTYIAKLRTVATPVTLKYFSGEIFDNTVLLNWTSAAETGNNIFIIERSTDGKTFAEITTIKGAGNSEEEKYYSYTDRDAIQGTSYYRLKYESGDGEGYAYSSIVEVSVGMQETFSISDIGPNPVANTLGFSVTTGEEDTFQLEITDMLGKTVKEKKLELKDGRNPVEWSMEDLSRGMYFLKCRSSQRTETRKFLKQ